MLDKVVLTFTSVVIQMWAVEYYDNVFQALYLSTLNNVSTPQILTHSLVSVTGVLTPKKDPISS